MKKYYIGSGSWYDRNWIDEKGNPTQLPTASDDVIIDDKCNELHIGHKKWKRKLFKLINKLTFNKFRKKFAFTIKGHVVFDTTGTIYLKGDVDVEKTLRIDYSKK